MKARMGMTALVLTTVYAQVSPAQTQLGYGITYQASLHLAGDPINDTADFEFTLWDDPSAGAMVGAAQTLTNVIVVDGVFTVELDFGVNAFNGDQRWLEIAVRSPAGVGDFALLSPRQPVTATPYALQTRGVFVDENGRVGLGTTEPERVLHTLGDIILVERDGNEPAIMLKNTLGGANLRSTYGLNSAGWAYITDEGLNRVLYIGDQKAGIGGLGTNELSVFGNADFTGSVGIGTTTPATALDVNGSVTATAFVGDGSELTNLPEGVWNENGADISYIDGNVGIGTTTPFSTLDVNGHVNAASLAASGDLTAGIVGIGTTVPTDSILDVEGDVHVNDNDIFLRAGADRNHGVGWYGAAKPFGESQPDGPVLYGFNGGALATKNGGQQQVLTWNNAGNVGIGTDAPQNQLHVTAAGATANIRLSKDDNNYANNVVFSGSGTQYNFGTPMADRLRVWNDQTGEVLTILPSGNVGFSTTNPSSTLDVNGNAEINGSLNMMGNSIGGVASPTAAGDVATKGYVDAAVDVCNGMVVVVEREFEDVTLTCPEGMAIIACGIGKDVETRQRAVSVMQGVDDVGGQVCEWDCFGASTCSAHSNDETVAIAAICACTD